MAKKKLVEIAPGVKIEATDLNVAPPSLPIIPAPQPTATLAEPKPPRGRAANAVVVDEAAFPAPPSPLDPKFLPLQAAVAGAFDAVQAKDAKKLAVHAVNFMSGVMAAADNDPDSLDKVELPVAFFETLPGRLRTAIVLGGFGAILEEAQKTFVK